MTSPLALQSSSISDSLSRKSSSIRSKCSSTSVRLVSSKRAVRVRATRLDVVAANVPPLACPVSMKELDNSGYCSESGLTYAPEDQIWDLTLGVSKKDKPASLQDLVRQNIPSELRGFLPQSDTFGTSTFELPTVAFAYERGWRQGFARAGFPGPDAEFELAQKALLPAAQGGVLVDASCGSGLFTRRFVRSGTYQHVVALDFSESMLRQAQQFFREEAVPTEAASFVRADIARLPFPGASIDGLHAGAAIHCWPDPQAAVAEIARVLKPGATYCGTTFLNPQLPFLDQDQQQLFTNLVKDFTTRRTGFQYWDVGALQDLFASCGLVDFQSDIRQNFIFYSVRKPEKPFAEEPAAPAAEAAPIEVDVEIEI